MIRKYIGSGFTLLFVIQLTAAERVDSVFLESNYDEAALESSNQKRAVGTFTQINNAPPFVGVVDPILLTDGSVMVQTNAFNGNVGQIWKLVPDNTGSYINGTWSRLADLPAGYAPLFYASAVLPDGRVIYVGGEFNNAAGPVWTNLSAIYDPVANSWSNVIPPAFFSSNIGDACSVILEDGTFMLQNPFYLLQAGNTVSAALLNANTLAWTPTGTGKFDANDEEGWTLLPNGKVLTVDCYVNLPSTPPAARTNTEVYDPTTGTWSSAGNTVASLTEPNSFEMGPQVLRADGTVFAVGATGKTGIYNATTGIWSAGPDLPIVGGNQMACQDAPGALLPNGDVLFAACTLSAVNDNGNPPTFFFEFDGATYTQQPNTVFDAGALEASQFQLLVLPNGQILVACIDTNAVYTFTPSNTSFNSAWQPIIYCVPKVVRPSQTYQISGVLFNGMSQAGMFGDDYQCATNYPLVRITNNSTGHVFYCRTHGHSFMGVAATTQKVSTNFDIPSGIELGKSTLEVVANGIPSQPICIYVDVAC